MQQASQKNTKKRIRGEADLDGFGVEGRHLGDVVEAALTLLLLQLQ